MSPAGDWPQLRAAVEAGADAVYFGLKHFSARAKVGFPLGELPVVMRTLHQRGVRGYITFNTLVFEHELPEAARTIAAVAEAGTDAMIVQDFGIVRLTRRIVPDMVLHASTQMSITDAAGVALAQSHGIRRVTMARELSLEEVRSVVRESGCEIEIFVHGALCVAYSGQCFSSEAWGGRSANRGQCAQACRLPYELMVDGSERPLGDARYLLSPGDLYALHQVPEIVEAGVAALKIEGRYKDADYVALSTRAYREAVDNAWAERNVSIPRETELQLEQVYSRSMGPYFITGTNHQAVVGGRSPRHRGVRMGRVTRVERERVVVAPSEGHDQAPLKAGDGVVFDAADWRSPEEPEEGGRVYEVSAAPDRLVTLAFGNGAIDFGRIRPGDLVWRTHDPNVDRAARAYTSAAAPVARQSARVTVKATEGEPLAATWTLVDHPETAVTVTSGTSLGAARNRGVSVESVREHLGRLGNTPYTLAGIDVEVSGAPFLPVSLLNRLRREAVERLQELQGRPRSLTVADTEAALAALSARPSVRVPTERTMLDLLVRTPEQLETALDLRPDGITLDYLDLYGLRPAVERVRSAGLAPRVASPRVLKPGETRIADFLVNLNCAILVLSAGLLFALRQREHPALDGDFSLNAANSITARTLLDLGLSMLTPTHDLNAEQIAEFARQTGADRVEAVVYQHLPVFHTEHCVFCRFLSTGASYRDCGRPCEKHRVELKDPSGRTHPVTADVGCRNTVFGAEAQEASAHLESWRNAGIRRIRLEFVHESTDEVRRVFGAFRRTLDGDLTASELAAELRSIAPEGTTEGSLFIPPGYLVLPVLQ